MKTILAFIMVFVVITHSLGQNDSSLIVEIKRVDEFFVDTDELGDNIESMAINPDGTMLAVGTKRQALLLDITNGEIIQEYVHNATVQDVEFSLDGTQLVVSIGRDVQSNRIYHWDIETGERFSIINRQLTFAPRNISFNYDGSLMLVYDSNRPTIYDAETGEELGDIAESEVAAFSRTGQYIAANYTVGNIQEVIIFDLAEEEAISFPIPDGYRVIEIEFNLDDTLVAVAYNEAFGSIGEIKIYDVTSGELYAEWQPTQDFIAHSEHVVLMDYSPDGRVIASGTDTGWLWLWDAETGLALNRIRAHSSDITGLVFHPDGNLIYTSHGQEIRIWELDIESD